MAVIKKKYRKGSIDRFGLSRVNEYNKVKQD